MMNHESKRPVTLEDLLRLKRAERPSAEFWSQFDRELRAKQLAALVEKRPWWSAVPRAFSGFSRYHLPLGAAAVLALTIVSVREMQPVSSASSKQASSSNAEPAALVAASAPEGQSTSIAMDVPASAAVDTATVSDDKGLEPRAARFALESNASVAPASPESAPSEEVALEVESAARQALPNMRSMSGNVPVLRGSEATFARDLLAAPRSSETRLVASSKQRMDPLAQMTPPTEARRSSLLNASFTSPAYLPSTRSSSSRIARGLSDEQLYDTVSRIGARGNSLSLKL